MTDTEMSALRGLLVVTDLRRVDCGRKQVSGTLNPDSSRDCVMLTIFPIALSH